MGSITADNVLFLHEVVRKMYPEGVTKGHINRQAVDAITQAAFLTIRGRPVYDTPIKQAAALMEGIIRLHPFPDGNKRTALLTVCSFLQINDHYLAVPLDTIQFMVKVAENAGSTAGENEELVKDIVVWLEARTTTASGEYNKLLRKYVARPIWGLVLLSLTGIGYIYAKRRLRQWLASDTHPEYREYTSRTISFLFTLTKANIQNTGKYRGQ